MLCWVCTWVLSVSKVLCWLSRGENTKVRNTAAYKMVDRLLHAILIGKSQVMERVQITKRATDSTMMAKVPAPIPSTKVDGTSSEKVGANVGECVGCMIPANGVIWFQNAAVSRHRCAAVHLHSSIACCLESQCCHSLLFPIAINNIVIVVVQCQHC